VDEKMKDKLKIVSLCDGMSCGALALEPWLDQQGLTWDDIEYHAFEIDKYADAVSQYNYPLMYRHGDARKYKKLIGNDIFLLMGGFPCQPYSFSGKGKADADSRDLSNLIFDALKDLKPKYFLFENVVMKKEHQNRISDGIGVDPIMINSSDFSAQNRKRLYWTNIKIDTWEDHGVVLKNILEDVPFEDIPNYLNNTWCGRKRGDMVKSVDDPKASCLTASMWKGQIPTFVKKPIHVGDATNISGYDIIKRVYHEDGKSPTLTTMQGGHREPKVAISCGAIRGRYKIDGVRQDHKMKVSGLTTQQLEIRLDEKTNCLTTVQKDNVVVDNQHWLYRKLTTTECEALQTIPKDYTKYGVFTNDKDYDSVLHEHCQRKPISKTQRYKMVGNGWTVAVISHIMKNMEV
tara:strand:- start:3608 stop:4819 length:1212 start_codon:yes stop_codon:yes gene_type:complete